MSNQRRAKRYTCLVPVDGKKGTLFGQTLTFDISKGGMGLLSQQKIPLNKKIAVALDLFEHEEPVLVIGKVRWINPLTDESGHYRIGMSFDEVLGGTKSRIEQYFRK